MLKQRWARVLLGLAAGTLALVLLAWLALPSLVKSQAEQRASAWLGRTLTIGEVQIRPWELSLTVSDVKLAAAHDAAGPPQAELRRLFVDADWRSLINRAPVIAALEIDAPRLRLTRLADGRYDIDDLIARVAPSAPEAPPSEPARFALHNLQLRDGAVSVDDRPAQRLHRLDGLTLGLPFLSNLPADVEVKVQPHLAFTLDGTRFDSGAEATPFAPRRAAELRLRMNGLTLDPWLPYLPRDLPVRPRQGRLDADLSLSFQQGDPGKPHQVELRGHASASDVKLVHADGSSLASIKSLRLPLAGVRPLAHELDLGMLQVDGLELHLERDARGRVKLPSAAAVPAAGGPSAAAPATGGVASAPAAPPAPTAWRVALQGVQVQGAVVEWRDASTRPAARARVEGLDVTLDKPRWPIAEPGPLRRTWPPRCVPGWRASWPRRAVCNGRPAPTTRCACAWSVPQSRT